MINICRSVDSAASGSGARRLRNRIRRGARQSTRMIIKEDGSPLRRKQRYIEDAVNPRKASPGRKLEDKLLIDEVWVYSANEIYKVWPK